MTLIRALYHSIARTLFKRSWSRLELEEVVRRFSTPRAVRLYMSVCFEYVHDHEVHGVHEHWKMPRDMLADGFGDCEDYSVFAWYVLKTNGYAAQILAAFSEDEGHCVCLFREGDWFHTLCNEGTRPRVAPGGRRNEDDSDRVARAAAERIFPRTWTACSYVTELREVDGPDGHARRYLPAYQWIERRGGPRT